MKKDGRANRRGAKHSPQRGRKRGANIAHKIDTDFAKELYTQCGDWASVARQYNEKHGTTFKRSSIYSACYHALDDSLKQPRAPRDKSMFRSYRKAEGNLAAWWRPGAARWVPMTPCYRTDTVRRSDPKP